MKIIGITGPTCAGKSVIVDYIRQKYKLPILKTGELLRDYLIKKEIPLTSKNFMIASNKFRKNKESIGILARNSLIKYKKGNIRFVLIDALRGKYDLEFYKKFADRIFIIGLFANQRTRFERILKRRREIDTYKSFNSFQKADTWQFNFGVGKLFMFSDFIIDTNLCPQKKSFRIIDKIMKQIKNET